MGCLGSKEAAASKKYAAPPSNQSNGAGAGAESKVTKQASSKSGRSNYGKPSLDDALCELYDPVHQLGSGGTGDSWLVKDRETGEYLAVKLVKRAIPSVLQPMMLREIEIQSELGEGHLNIIKSTFALLTDKHLGISMEYASGGSLTQYVTDRFPRTGQGLFLTEEETRYFFKQIISAIEYCHDRNVAHRDLKLDNTLLDGSDPPYIKICDFGFAKSWGDDNETANLYTQIGTPVYMSPEVIHAKESKTGYDPKSSDLWSAGVLLYVMLLGSFPFDHEEQQDPNSAQAQQEVYDLQTSNHWSSHPSNPKGVEMLSSLAKDLMDKIFEIDSSRRISLQEIKEHPWYNLPLEHRHQSALEVLSAEQAKIPKQDPNTVDEIRSSERHKRLEKMIAVAGTAEGVAAPPSLVPELDPGMPFVCRVDLCHEAIAADRRQSLLIGGATAERKSAGLMTIEEDMSHRGGPLS